MFADLVLFHGKFYTLNAAQPRSSALAVRDGQIVYVGDDATARSLLRPGPGAEAIDLQGCCAIPGLTDAHLHFSMYALGLQHVNAETPTLDEALARVGEHCARTPVGGWVTGFGFNHNVWDGQFPTAAQLDRVAPHHPVAIAAKSGHARWVNSKALELAHITAGTPDPFGGHIVRDARGQPTGMLLEEAMGLVERLIPGPTVNDVVKAMRQGIQFANRAGLTGVHDLDGALAFQAHQLLHQNGERSLRVLKSIPLENLNKALAVGLRTGFGNDWLRIGPVKMFADGALGPRTALMLAGYTSAPDESGIGTTDPKVLREAVCKANAAGLACAMHAIGDRACRMALDIYEEAQTQGLTGTLRNRIEHVQVLHPNDYARLGSLGVIASMQPIHATSDMLMADKHWGKERCAGAYALKTQLKHHAVLALGSDCPVEVIDPLVGIHAAVTRRRADGTPGPEGWRPEQRLTVEEAVRGFTWGPAYAAGMEDKLGALQPGKLADVTILEQDIFTIDPMDILNARVMGAVVGGRLAWRDQSL